MLTIIKLFSILFLRCLWEQGTPWQFLKQIRKLSSQLSIQIFSLFGQTEGERKAFFGPHCEIIPKSTWLSSEMKKFPFVKFETIQPLLCFLSDHLTNNHCRTWSPIINLWITSRTCQK